MVSGDDDGHVYILRPTTETIGDWSPYEKVDMIDTTGITTGNWTNANQIYTGI